MSRLAHATYAAPGLEAERRNLDATVRHEAKQRALQRTAGPGTPHQCPHGHGFKCAKCWPKSKATDPITAHYTDRNNGARAAKAP